MYKDTMATINLYSPKRGLIIYVANMNNYAIKTVIKLLACLHYSDVMKRSFTIIYN